MDALRAFQFPPEIIHVADSPRQFMLQMHAYLRSGIPVVLFLDTEKDAHAVTAVGYATDSTLVETHEVKSTLVADSRVPVTLRNLQYREIFVHDDRMGPYARADLHPQPGNGAFEVVAPEAAPEDEAEEPVYLPLVLGWPKGKVEHTSVRLGIVPLYPKLRTCAEELLHSALRFAPFLEMIVSGTDLRLGLEVYFDRAGTYQRSLYGRCEQTSAPGGAADDPRTQPLRRREPLVRG